MSLKADAAIGELSEQRVVLNMQYSLTGKRVALLTGGPGSEREVSLA